MPQWSKRARDGDAQRRAEQELELAVAQRMMPYYEEKAADLAALPAEELTERMRAAFTLDRR